MSTEALSEGSAERRWQRHAAKMRTYRLRKLQAGPVYDEDETILYAISCGDFHKIGLSTNPLDRLAAIRTSAPMPVGLAATWRVPRIEAHVIEAQAHRILAPFHSHCEWFRVPLILAAGAVKIMSRSIYATGRYHPDTGATAEGGDIDYFAVADLLPAVKFREHVRVRELAAFDPAVCPGRVGGAA